VKGLQQSDRFQKRQPGEPSFLAFGLALEASKTLGKAYEQNAIIWCGADAVPNLVLLI
jgi:hypothetical protein